MENGNQPATKQDLRELETALRAEIQGFRQEMQELRQEMQGHVSETVQNVETNLLKAFYHFAETHHQHHGQLDRDSTFLRARMQTLEARILEIEKRLNMPPAG